MAATAFQKGDRVAWDHLYATQHGSRSVVLADAVTALAPDAKFGTVEAVANDEGTWFEVLIDGRKNTLVLTQDELVKVEEPDA